jgi:hypothetical protein
MLQHLPNIYRQDVYPLPHNIPLPHLHGSSAVAQVGLSPCILSNP